MPISDLNNLMFTDPTMFQRGTQMLDTQMAADQLANQQAQANIDRSTLANQFAAQNNPLMVQHQQAINDELGMRNELTRDTMSESKEAKRAAFVRQLNDDQLGSFMAKAKLDLMSDNADTAARARRQIDASQEEYTRRQKEAADANKAQIAADARMTGYQLGLQGKMYSADKQLEGVQLRMQKANNQGKTIMDAVAQGKMDFQKAATSFGVMAAMEEDPARAQAYGQLAQKFEAAAANNASRLAGTPDLAKMGIDVNQFQSVLGNLPRIPGGAPQAPAASMAPTRAAGPTNAGEAGMSQAVSEMVAKFNTPEEMQSELSKTQAMLPSLSGQDRTIATQYMQELQKRLGGAQAPKKAAPAVGTVMGGYKFKGGDPSKKDNWEKQ